LDECVYFCDNVKCFVHDDDDGNDYKKYRTPILPITGRPKKMKIEMYRKNTKWGGYRLYFWGINEKLVISFLQTTDLSSGPCFMMPYNDKEVHWYGNDYGMGNSVVNKHWVLKFPSHEKAKDFLKIYNHSVGWIYMLSDDEMRFELNL